MKIENLDELKITSIKYYGSIVYFKYREKFYTLANGGAEMALCLKLFEGIEKGKLKLISASYGWTPDLIKAIIKVLKYKAKEYNMTFEKSDIGNSFKGGFWEDLLTDNSNIPNVVYSNKNGSIELRSF